MKKLLFIFLILLGIFLGLIIAVPIFFKGTIVKSIKKAVNEELTATVEFDENIGLSLIRSFPNLSLQIDAIEVVNGGDFEGDTLLKMKSFQATLDIMSVLKGDEIHIRSIVLDEPIIHARVLADGRANWDITKQADEETPDTSADSEATTPFKVSLKRYEIRNGRVKYDDLESDMSAELIGLNHSGKGDFSQDDFILETLTEIQTLTYIMEGIPYLNKVNTEMKCDIGINMPAMRFDFKENTLRLNALEIGLDGFLAMPDDNMSMDLKVISKKTSLKEILSLVPSIYTHDFTNVQTSGNTALDMNLKGVLNTELEIYPAFEVELMVENGTFNYPDLPEKLSDIQFLFRVNNADGQLDHTVVNLQKLHFLFGKEPFDMRLLLTKPLSQPYVEMAARGLVMLENVENLIPLDEGTKLAGRVQADFSAKGNVSSFEGDNYEAMNASGFLNVQNLVYSDGQSLPYELVNLGLAFSPKTLNLQSLIAKYGHSDFKVSGEMSNYLAYLFKEGEVLTGRLDVSAGLLDCNAFLSEEGEEQVEAPAPNDTMELEAFVVPENILFDLNLNMDKVLYDNLTLNEVKGAAQIKEQVLYFNGVEMGIFGGKVTMEGTYDSKNPEQPKTAMKLGLQDVGIKETFQYINTVQILAPIAEHLSGRMNLSTDLSSLLNKDMTPVLSSISSSGFLKTAEAVLSGFQPTNALADKLQLDALKTINIGQTNISYTIQDGKVSLKNPVNLKLNDMLLAVEENGYTTFDQLINYKLKLTVPKSILGGAGNSAILRMLGEANKLGINVGVGDKLTINALLGGTIKSPKITTSFNEIKENLENQVKEEVKKVIDEKKEEVKKKVDELAQELINKASAKGDQLIEEARKKADMLKAEAEKQGNALKAEADKQAAELLKQAGSNPIKKLAAEKAGDKLKQEAKLKADMLNGESEKKGKALIKEAEDQKAKLIADAQAEKNKRN